LYFSLVSNKNLTEILSSCSWSPGSSAHLTQGFSTGGKFYLPWE